MFLRGQGKKQRYRTKVDECIQNLFDTLTKDSRGAKSPSTRFAPVKKGLMSWQQGLVTNACQT